MAESTNALTRTQLKVEVADLLGYTRSSANWNSDRLARIEACVDHGYRQFLAPPALPEAVAAGDGPHEWSFVKPTTTMIAWATTTGTVSGSGSYSSPSTTITATASIFHPLMVGANFTFDTSETDYVIDGYTSGTVVTVTGDASGEAADDTLTITATGNYQMPDDFGSIDGPFHYDTDAGWASIPVVAPWQILERRQVGSGTGQPSVAAIRPKASTGASGQRFEAMFFVTPGQDTTLRYRYYVLQGKLTDSLPYHLGGAAHSQTVLASMLEYAARMYRPEQHRIKQEFWWDRLRSSIAIDHRAGWQTLLTNRDRSDMARRRVRVLHNDVTLEGNAV